ncbi:MAG: SufE family protein [Cytophagales bacterium]|nr:SufE family protein [Cytophagales bacterium]
MTIDEQQKQLIAQFQLLDGDMEMALQYIMELGEELPGITDEERSDENIVKGCQSKVWLIASLENGKIQFKADSNTAITKGLVSMLVKVLNHQRPEDVLSAEIHFPEKIGMNRFIGTQRSNGFASMIKQINYYAVALSTEKSNA